HIDGDYPQNDQNVITIGGSGFGLMAILVGIHNEYITREEGAERIGRALAFLDSVDRFQGAWSHWYHGDTGKPKAFSEKDNCGENIQEAEVAGAGDRCSGYYKTGSEKEQGWAKLAQDLWK